MDNTGWRRVAAAFATAVELPRARREGYVAGAFANEPLLQAELRSLLSAHDSPSNALDIPPECGTDDCEAQGRLEAQVQLAPGSRLGPWSLGALIGRGGAGDVYLAQRADGAFEQQVAVKLLRREALGQVLRFNAERQILARLDHPGIARLLDGGLAPDGRPYAVVEYVAGEPLIAHCRAQGLDLAARLRLFAQVCEIVAYAHRNLIVHRDLKSGNILVTPEGRVKLLDFGIAK